VHWNGAAFSGVLRNAGGESLFDETTTKTKISPVIAGLRTLLQDASQTPPWHLCRRPQTPHGRERAGVGACFGLLHALALFFSRTCTCPLVLCPNRSILGKYVTKLKSYKAGPRSDETEPPLRCPSQVGLGYGDLRPGS
jgi:hypothetical protein